MGCLGRLRGGLVGVHDFITRDCCSNLLDLYGLARAVLGICSESRIVKPKTQARQFFHSSIELSPAISPLSEATAN